MAQHIIKGFDAGGIALYIAAMAILAVEIDKIGHEQAFPVPVGQQLFRQGLHICRIVPSMV